MDKKRLREQYKEREVKGGIYAIRNKENQRQLVETTTDLRSSRNRFEFAVKTGSCVHMSLQGDWGTSGGKQFEFVVLDELAKKKEQSEVEFRADLETLKELRLSALVGANLY